MYRLLADFSDLLLSVPPEWQASRRPKGLQLTMSAVQLQALPSDKPEEWQPREEAQDLWSVYITKESDSEKQQELARILDIPPQEQDQLRSLVQSGEFKLEGEDQAEGDIF